MTRGLNKYEGKDKRRQRMKNHVAKDLKTGTKYHQRIIPARKKKYILHPYTEDQYSTGSFDDPEGYDFDYED